MPTTATSTAVGLPLVARPAASATRSAAASPAASPASPATASTPVAASPVRRPSLDALLAVDASTGSRKVSNADFVAAMFGAATNADGTLARGDVLSADHPVSRAYSEF